jgi:signal transduction histidine kinase/CheY-like chemotaxis protein
MPEPGTERLLTFARKLHRAADFAELIEIVAAEAREVTGYQHAWLMIGETEALETFRLIDISSVHRELAWEVAPVLTVKGDAFLEELVRTALPLVIVDARTDPRTNKEIVERLQNRTLINIPLQILDRPLGWFGVGTFGDEGCREPSGAELDYLQGMAAQITVAASRIRLLDTRAREQKQHQELERRLMQVQKLESLGMLAGGIAHDFNNLLTVILSSATLAQSQTTDQALSEDLQAVLDAATRGRDLTRQLLAMSRSQELDLKALDINQRLSELVQLARRILPENIRLDLIEAARLPLVEGDASQLDQVFMNLFINARDAMPDGGRLTVETEQVLVNGAYTESHPWAKAGRYVLVTVTDTGVGMSREVLERVFEPFFTTKAARSGTGLGLAVAYGIVRQHRGMLHCYSELGVGTTFKIYLPAGSRLAGSVGTKLQNAVRHGTERLLVAEDDELVRGVLLRILKGAGYEVTGVDSGDAACRAAARDEFDLVILDMVMPGMPCREVIHRLRALRSELPILLSSGYAAGENVATLVKEEGLELLSKPYDPDQVLRAVRAVLDGQSPPAAST